MTQSNGIALALLAVGLLLLFEGIRLLLRGRRSRSWPQAEGVIVSAGMETTSDGGMFYEAQIVYRYVVDGCEFSGSEVGAGKSGPGGRRAAEHTLRKYPVGSTVRVHYSPAAPGTSVLEPGLHLPIAYYFLVAPVLVAQGWPLVSAYF